MNGNEIQDKAIASYMVKHPKFSDLYCTLQDNGNVFFSCTSNGKIKMPITRFCEPDGHIF